MNCRSRRANPSPPESANRVLIFGCGPASHCLVELVDYLAAFLAPFADQPFFQSPDNSAIVGYPAARRDVASPRARSAGLVYRSRGSGLTRLYRSGDRIECGKSRYGTWTISTPEIILNSSPDTWVVFPVPLMLCDSTGISLGVGDKPGTVWPEKMVPQSWRTARSLLLRPARDRG